MADSVYDVVVVGSGAGGGTLAAHLARAGASVLVLEGGPRVNTRTDFNTHALPHEFPSRSIPVMKPGKPGFDSERSRGLGGKTMLWNAVALRFSERDLRGRTHDGTGEDWPFGYAELAPYYDRIEREVGVCGNADGLRDLPDGHFLPAIPLKCTDHIIAKGAAQLGLKVVAVRKATLSRPFAGRPACHFCGNCMAGCDVVAKYNSADVHMLPALKTGKLTLRPDSVVYDLAVGDGDKVREVRYFDRITREEGAARGRAVVVACACVQSVALLLMSRSARFRNGLANNNGQLGRHFIPHINAGIEAFLTAKIGTKPVNDEGFLDHAYIPSFMHEKERPYGRSFAYQFNYQNRRSVGWARTMPGMGKGYKQAVKARYPAYLNLTGYMEMTPNAQSYIDLDPENTDAYGLPLARRRWVLSAEDKRRWEDMRRWGLRILEASGAEIHHVWPQPNNNHEIGGARMGLDPATSTVNQWCQAHEVPNLFLADASVFPSASEKNPTHTIMALAARTAEHIATQLKEGKL